MMGTFVRMDVCASPEEAERIAGAYKSAWDRLREIAWRMNVYDGESDVAAVNRAFDDPARIGADTYGLLQRSARYSEVTGRAFDVTVWPLILRWRRAAEEQIAPAEEELRDLRASLSMARLEFLPDNRVARKNEVVNIDLGAVAKGYAVDEAARIFEKEGFRNYYIDAGGDVYAGGLNCKNEKWRIGVQSPFEKRNIIRVAALTNQSMATSGNYEQYFTVGEKTYSHIIDPATGYPQERVVSASVIAPTAEEADAYATALTVMGAEKGAAFIENLGDNYAALIVEKSQKGEITQKMTKSFQRYLLR
jgi:thiamine biosynthesis lipoprotein